MLVMVDTFKIITLYNNILNSRYISLSLPIIMHYILVKLDLIRLIDDYFNTLDKWSGMHYAFVA